jgi:hypothetical protein
MACSRGEAIEGVIHRRRHAPGIGGIKDLTRASGENLLSVERAARAPDIYIGGQMRDAHLLRCVAHFFRHVAHYFPMRDAHLVRRVTLLFPMGNTWVPNG